MSGLRIFTEQDVSPVADLIWKVLHNGKGPAPASLPAIHGATTGLSRMSMRTLKAE
jgi:hypothetical protein